jgi:formylglycine-generating enzyme required for sulfatase activity
VSISQFYIRKFDITVQQYCDYLNSAMSQKLLIVGSGSYPVTGGPRDSISATGGVVYLTGGKDILFLTRQAYQYGTIDWDGSKFSVMDNRNNHPATGVTWFGAAVYCNWLSLKEGYQPCYNTSTWDCDFAKNGYRLPTEAEWEYAARGGQYNPYYNYPWGNDADQTKANWPNSGDPYETGPFPHTTPVGFYNGQLQKKADFNWPGSQQTYQTSNGANAYGLYDMAGNVWQWCNDWYRQDYYAVSPAVDTTGPKMTEATRMQDGKIYRCMRGGNWYNGEPDKLLPAVDNGHSRVSNRDPAYYLGEEDYQYSEVGFRVVRRDASGTTLTPSTTTTNPTTSISNRTVGLFLNDSRAWPGYTLLAPKQYTTTYLIDNQGRVVHTWTSKYPPGQSAYLLPNGDLIRAATIKNPDINTGGGEGGRIEEYDWGGNLVW